MRQEAAVVATACGALVWLWLMHNRHLPLNGPCSVARLAAALACYGLVAAPAWSWAHPAALPVVWEVRLMVWVIVFFSASMLRANAYTAPLQVIVAVFFLFIVAFYCGRGGDGDCRCGEG